MARDFLTTCELIVNVAACLNGLAVSKLQTFLFVGLRGSFVCVGVPGREKQVNRFPEFPCNIVLDLGLGAARLPCWPLRRLCSVIETGQVDYYVTPPDQRV